MSAEVNHFLSCSRCTHPNEMPFMFCDECGAPRSKLGHLRVTGNLSLTLSAFFCTFYFAEVIEWPWPLYVLYAALFYQFTLALTRGRRKETLRLGSWIAIFLGGIGVIFHVLRTWGPLFFLSTIRLLPEQAQQQPRIFWPATLAILVVVFLPLYFRWRRLFGWVNAYRIILLSLLMLTLAAFTGLGLLEMIHSRMQLTALEPELTTFLQQTKPKYDHIFGLLSLFTFRIFLFEVFVFAAVRGYAQTQKQKSKILSRDLKKESGLVRSALVLASVVQRFLQALENMVHYLLQTVMALAIDLAQVVLAFMREIFLPVVSLTTASVLIYLLANLTTVYINGERLITVAWCIAAIIGVVLCEMVFLGCKTSYHWGRILAFHGQFVGWLLPNLIVFFLLLSFSLWGSSEVVNTDDPAAPHLPFYIGILTKSFAVVLVLLVVVVLWHKRTLIFDVVDSAAKEDEELGEDLVAEEFSLDDEGEVLPDASDVPEPAMAGGASLTPQQARQLTKRRKRQGWDIRRGNSTPDEFQGAKQTLLNSARAVLDRLPMRDRAGSALKNLNQKIQGRPEVVGKLVEARQHLHDRTQQLDALEKTKSSITPETYLPLQKQYVAEIAQLQKDIQKYQGEVDRLCGELAIERTRLNGLLEKLRAKFNEARQLQEAGAIQGDEFERRTALLRFEIEKAEAELRTCERRFAFFANVVTLK